VPSELIVVTAASSNHAGALRHMLASLKRLDAAVVCYDLGLTPQEIDALPRWERLAVRRFDYAAYPPHMDVTVNAGEYAWKPVIVAAVADEERRAMVPRHVVWADAGSYFDALGPIANAIDRSDGIWLRRSSGTVADWTHPGMFAFLGEDGSRFADRPNADATLVGLATGHASAAVREAAYRDIIAPWAACATARDCIAPAGSSRRNHRQDQAVLTYLVHKAGYQFADATRETLRVRCKCDRWFYRYIGFNVPAALYSRCCLY
jgi:hypothetical protein